eukprot:TRINITY_DN9336_c0_g3_i1.p1 TRINITY_DN9336_c0_g3~~TRINITY_DN9336_c0_g3_i1.p1  ORF type:complete len:325 (+),score=84.89 TRINITY_DN9336_c0_g3_i1:203-1177(+)
MYWEMFKSLMDIHSVFNGRHVSQKDALVYETQLEEDLQSLIDILEYLNPNFAYKVTSTFNLGHESVRTAAVDVKTAHAKRELCQLLREFLESLSAAYTSLPLTCMIWDNIFLKSMARKKSIQVELYLAFAIILCVLSEDLLLCKTPSEFVMTVRANISEVYAYDYYLIYVEAHRKQLLPQLKDDAKEHERSIAPTVKKRSTARNPLNDQFDQNPEADARSRESVREPSVRGSVVNPRESRESARRVEETKKSIEKSKSSRPASERESPANETKRLGTEELKSINEEEKEAEVSVKDSASEQAPINRGTLAVPDIDEYDIFADLG